MSQTSQEVKPSILANNLAEQAALEEIKTEESNPSLKDAWMNLGDQLEIEGISKQKIQSVASDLIRTHLSQKTKIPKEEIKLSGYFYRVCKEAGWTSIIPNIESDENALGRKENSSINTKNITVNAEMIDIFIGIKEICNLGIDKAKNNKEFSDIFNKKQLREFYKQQLTFISNCKDTLDDKTKIPVNTELLFIESVSMASGSLNNAVKIFHNAKMKLLEDQGKKLITAKQTAKYLNGDKTSKLPLLKPDSRDTAIFAGYFGIQCNNDKCKSWRVRKKMDKQTVECFDCDNEFNAKTVSKCTYCQTPLFKEQLIHIVKTSKCENCNSEVHLPDELIQYASS